MTNNTEISGEKKRNTGRTILICLIVAALVCAGIIVGLKIRHDKEIELKQLEEDAKNEALRQEIINSDRFPEGVTVCGVNISGMTFEEAKSALKDVESELAVGVGFVLTDGVKSFTVPDECFNIIFDTDDVLDKAMNAAGDGTLDELTAELEDIRVNGRGFDISCTIEGNYESYVNKVAEEYYVAPENASFAVKEIPKNSSTNAPDARNIGYTEDEIEQGADIRDLRFDFTEGKDGMAVDTDELIAELNRRTETQEFGNVEFAAELLSPEITVESIKEKLVLRANAYTSYSSGHYGRSTRVHNMTKACGLIYGIVLEPEEVLSCNKLLGDRYEKYGWQLAPAVIEGGANTEDQPGGGVCQVSTTMYNAVLKGDLEVVYRRAHSSRLSYVDGGLDATINTGSIDFKWKNNTNSPIYVFCWIDTDKKKVYYEIYGEPFAGDFDEIELESERLPDIPATQPEYVEASWLYSPYWAIKNEAKNGYQYNSYKIYKKDGQQIKKELIALTEYKMHPLRYWVWPGYVPGTALDSKYKLAIENGVVNWNGVSRNTGGETSTVKEDTVSFGIN